MEVKSMSEKILAFETREAKFLRTTVEILKKIHATNCPENQDAFLYQSLESLILSNQDFLPAQYFLLLHVLNDVIHFKEDFDQQFSCIMEAFTLCEFLTERPSFELFKKMALCGIPILYDHSGFSEELLLSIVDKVKKLSFTNFNESDLMSEKAIEIMWISLAQMDTSEKVQLKIIESVNLASKSLISFCSEMIGSSSGRENVLLAIVNLLESKKLSQNNSEDSNFKAQLYYTILLCANPSEKIIKKIITVIKPKSTDYFNAFYMIMKEFGENKNILKSVSKRLRNDLKLCINIGIDDSTINQLLLLANNI